jgi:hypothetical protein
VGGSPTLLRNLFAATTNIRPHIVRRRVFPEGSEPPIEKTTTFQPPGFVRQLRGSHYLLVPGLIKFGVGYLAANPDARILAVIPEASFALAAWALSRLARRPYAVYFHDTYAEQQRQPLDRVFAAGFEPRLVRDARVVMSLTEGLGNHLLDKWGVGSEIVRHPRKYDHLPDRPSAPEDKLLVYSGDIYEMNFEALKRVVEAISRLHSRGWRMVLTTRVPESDLRARGLLKTGVSAVFLPTARDVERLQRTASALVAPLSFRSKYGQTEVATALPTKVVEYLETGRPLLVHAPPWSHLSNVAREFDLGPVVDRPSVDAIVAELLAFDLVKAARSFDRRMAYLARHSKESVVRAFERGLDALW